jgi:hypothetical protein
MHDDGSHLLRFVELTRCVLYRADDEVRDDTNVKCYVEQKGNPKSVAEELSLIGLIIIIIIVSVCCTVFGCNSMDRVG